MEVQGKLRPKWEMDNFFCSHRCLLTEVMVVRGAFGVLAPARPASSTYVFFALFLFFARLLTVMFSLVFLQFD
jgi:hypothetical protein